MHKLYVILISILLFASCEDVIEVDLQTSDPRLVIEASINVLEDGTTASTVRLTRTAPFFENTIPPVENAEVIITSETGEEFNFLHIGNGDYFTEFIPDPEVNYTLKVIDQGEMYSATAKLNTVSPILEVEQDNEGGFSGDEIQLRFFFQDPAGIANYYFIEGLSVKGNNRDAFNDEFFDGNIVPGFYFVEDLQPGDEVTFNLYGVDEAFYNFIFILLQQGSEESGGPFETQPATVRGNIINLTNPENFPLGYFRISELSTATYIIE